MRITIVFILFVLLISSCSYNELTVCETNNPSFSECIMPIFSKHCVECHFHNNLYEIMPLTNFIEIQDKIINGTIIESINREIGFMPKNGERLSAEQILIIEKWYENGTPNN